MVHTSISIGAIFRITLQTSLLHVIREKKYKFVEVADGVVKRVGVHNLIQDKEREKYGTTSKYPFLLFPTLNSIVMNFCYIYYIICCETEYPNQHQEHHYHCGQKFESCQDYFLFIVCYLHLDYIWTKSYHLTFYCP